WCDLHLVSARRRVCTALYNAHDPDGSIPAGQRSTRHVCPCSGRFTNVELLGRFDPETLIAFERLSAELLTPLKLEAFERVSVKVVSLRTSALPPKADISERHRHVR